MLLTIENGELSACIDSFGAELTLLRDRKDGIPLVCPEANEGWEGIAPVLFPNAGAVAPGGRFPLRKHGFARDLAFTPASVSPDSLTLVLLSDEGTRAMYPFDFSLSVTYALRGRTLLVSALTENRSADAMVFSLGFHPGFSCPFVPGERAEDYALVFPKGAKASRMLLEGGLVSGIEPGFLDGSEEIPVREGMFDGGSFSLTDLNFSTVRLESRPSGRALRVDFDGFPNLILWAPRHRQISCLCIEPWHGRPDRTGGEPEPAKKPDAVVLAPGGKKTLGFRVTMI